MSKTQVDRLGDRLRDGQVGEAELRALSEYRASFAPAYRTVFETIRDELVLDPTGRPAKSTAAIIEKLRRESIRLTQMQDIAGLRVVVPLIEQQDDVASVVSALFEKASVMDRRERPSHGYRAVHVVLYVNDVPVEVQVRTALQHKWAELSEKMSDLVDPAIKYGGGDRASLRILGKISSTIAMGEAAQSAADAYVRDLRAASDPDRALLAKVEAMRDQNRARTRRFEQDLDALLRDLRTLSGE
jgi:putative GTP pyrophosphokinase